MGRVIYNDDEDPTTLGRVLQLHGQFRRSSELIGVTPLQAGVPLYLRRHTDANMTIRDVPTELFNRVKLAAAVERRTVKGFLLALAEGRIQELEKNGLLPKEK